MLILYAKYITNVNNYKNCSLHIKYITNAVNDTSGQPAKTKREV